MCGRVRRIRGEGRRDAPQASPHGTHTRRTRTIIIRGRKMSGLIDEAEIFIFVFEVCKLYHCSIAIYATILD